MFDVSIIIVSYNSRTITIKCIDSIYSSLNNSFLKLEIILVDNASKDETSKEVKKKFKNVRVFDLEENIGYSSANNIGIRNSRGKYIFLLNSDTLLNKDTIFDLYNYLESNESSYAVAPKLLNEDLSFQRSFFNFPSLLKTIVSSFNLNHYLFIFIKIFNNLIPINFLRLQIYNKEIQNKISPFKVDYVIFASIMFRSKIFDEIGLLDENIFFYHEDCEFGFRMKKNNFNIIYLPSSEMVHYGGGSTKKVSKFAYENFFKGVLYFFWKYHSYKYYILKFYLFFYFQLLSFITILGFSKTLNVPSTYKNRNNIPFGNSLERFIFFQNLSLIDKQKYKL